MTLVSRRKSTSSGNLDITIFRRSAGLKNNVDFFKAALAESVERENNLVQYIEKHITKVNLNVIMANSV